MSVAEAEHLQELKTDIERKKEELKQVAQKKRDVKGNIDIDEELMMLSQELDRMIVAYMRGLVHKDRLV